MRNALTILTLHSLEIPCLIGDPYKRNLTKIIPNYKEPPHGLKTTKEGGPDMFSY